MSAVHGLGRSARALPVQSGRQLLRGSGRACLQACWPPRPGRCPACAHARAAYHPFLHRSTLHGNDLTGGLPEAWAQPGSFMVLKQLTLSDNPRLGGTLPAAWVSARAVRRQRAAPRPAAPRRAWGLHPGARLLVATSRQAPPLLLWPRQPHPLLPRRAVPAARRATPATRCRSFRT